MAVPGLNDPIILFTILLLAVALVVACIRWIRQRRVSNPFAGQNEEPVTGEATVLEVISQAIAKFLGSIFRL